MQTFIAISLLIVAAAFLSWNYVGKKLIKSSDKDGPCGPDCNCS